MAAVITEVVMAATGVIAVDMAAATAVDTVAIMAAHTTAMDSMMAALTTIMALRMGSLSGLAATAGMGAAGTAIADTVEADLLFAAARAKTFFNVFQLRIYLISLGPCLPYLLVITCHVFFSYSFPIHLHQMV
jgi:hypothetical protein